MSTVFLLILGSNSYVWSGVPAKPLLLFPVKALFNHQVHAKVFEKLEISCMECHNFSITSAKKGPLGHEVKEKLLTPPLSVCHQCHLGKVSLPRTNQCSACHTNATLLKPNDHFIAWRERHGQLAQIDKDSCRRCHSPQSCSQCHTKLDTMNPNVHRANFRLYHSIEARLNPQSCVTCHKSKSFCTDCHSGVW